MMWFYGRFESAFVMKFIQLIMTKGIKLEEKGIGKTMLLGLKAARKKPLPWQLY